MARKPKAPKLPKAPVAAKPARVTASPLVYVVRSERSGLLKIGTTTDLNRRLRELSRLCRGAVSLLTTLPGDAQLERRLHALCAADAVAGEWFRPSESVMGLVASAKRLAVRAGDGGEGTPPTRLATSPVWFAVVLRDPLLPVCGCVQTVVGVAYARARCPHCNGGGVLPSARVATTTTCAEAA